MRRRKRSRKWPALCFVFTMSVLPITAALRQSATNVHSSAAFQNISPFGEPDSWYDDENDINWNVSSEGFGWEEEINNENSTAITAATLPSENPGEKPYPTTWNLDTNATVKRTYYGTYSGTRFFNLFTAGQVQNKTSVSNNTLISESTAMPDFHISTDGKPQVLIMHTHTTESFEPYVRSNYDPSFNYRSTDPAYNMVSVGNAITAQLESAGIGVIHDTTVHDYPSYNGSYERSAETIKSILEQYPSICVVLDIHRDAIQDGNTLMQPVVEIDGKESAQVMIISGCDDGTMDMPNYMENFHFACRLQESMEKMYPGLTRPILFDYRKYNQDLTTGSLLLEVGTHGNTLEQVQYAGELIGKSLSQTLLQLKES